MNEIERWQNIPEHKKNNIYQACIEEFASYGYHQSSTNRIIKKAGISKGLLFHYFGNKKTLYLAVVDLLVTNFLDRFYEGLDDSSTDIFDKLLDWQAHKLKLFYKNPLDYKVLMESFVDIPVELKEELLERYQKLSEAGISSFLKDIDYSKFRKDVNPQQATELVILTTEAIGNKYMNLYKGREDKGLNDLNNIAKEIREYIQILKFGLYPQEKK